LMEGLDDVELLRRQKSYWEHCEATVDGMLGGFASVHDNDMKASSLFLDKLLAPDSRVRALDCGAGIGRVTKSLLLAQGFSRVDIQDISPAFLSTAREQITDTRLGTAYCSGLAEFDFDIGNNVKWDLIWIQWCAIYLRDDAFTEFFRRACHALAPGGYVVLKENVLSKGDKPVVDSSDASVTRSDAHLKRLWANGGISVVAEQIQTPWPSTLFPVKMYALQLQA
jgi:protein N-terminal methyltransferase